jgi:hypothetical protein
MCKLIVNVIGYLESQEATLADHMLELNWCTWQMVRLQIEDDENIAFWMHTKAVFNYEFHAMNMDIHTLANGKDWWENLPISGKPYSLKSLAIMLFSIVPHATDVEQLFVDLGGI